MKWLERDKVAVTSLKNQGKTSKNMKRCSAPLATMKVSIKTTIPFHTL